MKEKKKNMSMNLAKKINKMLGEMDLESKLIYDEEEFDELCPPRMIYVPCNNIIRKLMRV